MSKVVLTSIALLLGVGLLVALSMSGRVPLGNLGLDCSIERYADLNDRPFTSLNAFREHLLANGVSSAPSVEELSELGFVMVDGEVHGPLCVEVISVEGAQ